MAQITILVVDDEQNNRTYLETLLTVAGYTVATASDGVAALAQARTLRPDLVLTDISMPMMNGYQLAAALQADPTLAATKIVFSSAMYPYDKIEQLAASFGVRYVVHLPSAGALILHMIAAALLGLPSPAIPDLPSLSERLMEVVQDLKDSQAKP